MVASVFPDLLRHPAGRSQLERGIENQCHLCVKAVPKQPRANRVNARDASGMLAGVAQVTYNVRLDAIEHRVSTAMADCHTMKKIIAVISRPAMGSAFGKPAQTPAAPSTTARLVGPSTRA